MPGLSDYIEKNAQRYEEELFELLRIPSISTDSSKKGEIQKAADLLVKDLKKAGIESARKIATAGNPVVYAEHLKAGAGQPTVLIYGHYDVQPPDPLDLWDTPPFEPTVRDGKIFGRGSSDDKGQAFIHVKSIEAFLKSGTPLPVNVKFLIEGEEEIGGPSLVPFLKEHKNLLSCDMVLISDTAMFADETPSITYGLRGLCYMEIEVKGPNRDLHSGVYGGIVDNPANVLCGIIARLKDENGKITIPGFYDHIPELTDEEREAYQKLPFNEEAYKQELGIKATKGEKGYTILERGSARPTLDVNGLWSGYQEEGAKTVLPAKAGAKVSMRLVPDQNPDDIAARFEAYIKKLAPDTVTINIIRHHGGWPSVTNLDFYGMQAAAKAYKDVYGKEPLFTREGGSIPVVADFQKILGVDSILMGFGLDSDAIHSPNEHFALKDFHKGIRTSARFLEILPEFVKH